MEYLFYSRLYGENGHEAGRKLLSKAYSTLWQGELPKIAIDSRGKPYFVDSPVFFSISHTNRHVFCLLALEPVGVDAEEINRKLNPRLAEKILSDFEWKQYEFAEDKNKALLSFWVMKEAAVKLTGQGLTGYPNNTEFSLSDGGVMEIDGCVVAALRKDGIPCYLTRIHI